MRLDCAAGLCHRPTYVGPASCVGNELCVRCASEYDAQPPPMANSTNMPACPPNILLLDDRRRRWPAKRTERPFATLPGRGLAVGPSRLAWLVACALLASSGVLPAEQPATGAMDAPDDSPSAVRLTNPQTERWKLGVVVRAPGGVTGIVATLPVPMPWPEQEVKILHQEASPQVRSVRFQVLDEGVKQMSVSIPRLAAGDEASAMVTMEIVKRDIVAPLNTQRVRVPAKASRDMKKYLKPSPYIDSEDPAIVAAASAVTVGKQGGWEQAEAIFDWVRDKVEYRFDRNIKSARQALDDGFGDCEEMTSLFIAMCRASGIPARAVWVPGHCYPEFYLEEEGGPGHWYPCQAAGTRIFGAMAEPRPILQKGDNFRVPGARQPQRYVQETLVAKHAEVNPVVEFVRMKVD